MLTIIDSIARAFSIPAYPTSYWQCPCANHHKQIRARAAWGMNPEQLLTRDALTEGAVTRMDQETFENHQLALLSRSLKQFIRQEAVQMCSVGGGPDGNCSLKGLAFQV